MTSDLEEQKKVLLPILQRAEEIQALEPRMAYYCRLYAIKRGLELPQPTKEISGLIKATFLQCEKDKPAVKPDEEADRMYCENFALNVFKRADKVDRAGRADMNTCKAYYAAAIFLQVLEQFLKPGEELEYAAPDLLLKTRYALWRAAEIRKALREGRQPAPPPEAGSDMADGSAPGVAGADMFSGPSYEQSMPGKQQGMPPGDVPASNLDSIESATDDFLSLPKPPSTIPPAGSTGLLAPAAAAAGLRFRPGSRVWCCAPGSEGGAPEEGTVGLVLSPEGGPGGQAVYKVALRDRLEELCDSQMAPAVTAGARILYVASFGDPPVAGSVIAAKVDSWPCMYLLQLDTGRTLDTDAAHISQAEASGSSQGQPSGGYPGVDGGYQLPVAPPLVDPVTPAAAAAVPHSPPAVQQHQQRPPAAPIAPPPPAAAATGGSPYPSHQQPQRQQQHSGSPYRGGAQQPAAAAPAHAAAAAAAAAPAYQMPVLPPPGSFQPSGAAVSEAQKWAKFAVSSLGHDDVTGAVKFLADALRLLTQPSGK
ncbi:Vta1 like-domain-containing protein [Scenedesmus sp. NREL 46B-D3]|nr:Vta1 like-domain-containing protein [Scenedesmus sp. NREL 46B-D3]